MNQQTKIVRKMLVTFMSIAFFYLVIGDLITFHQKAIFNFDAFAGQPINKPDKGDKSSLYKLKDKKDRVLAKFLTFVSEHIQVKDELPIIFYSLLEFPFVKTDIFNPQWCCISFRGPPSL